MPITASFPFSPPHSDHSQTVRAKLLLKKLFFATKAIFVHFRLKTIPVCYLNVTQKWLDIEKWLHWTFKTNNQAKLESLGDTTKKCVVEMESVQLRKQWDLMVLREADDDYLASYNLFSSASICRRTGAICSDLPSARRLPPMTELFTATQPLPQSGSDSRTALDSLGKRIKTVRQEAHIPPNQTIQPDTVTDPPPAERFSKDG